MPATIDKLPFTGDDDADRLLVSEPLALLIGFALDQQVTCRRRSAARPSSNAGSATSMLRGSRPPTPATLDAVFRERPALHRFPGSMAGKVQQLAAAIASDYGNDADGSGPRHATGRISSAGCSGCPGSAR